MQFSRNPRQNKILGILGGEELTRLLPFLELVDMPLGQVIQEPGARSSQLYFPARHRHSTKPRLWVPD